MALANAIHLALLGAQGMRDVAVQSMEKAHYLARRAAQVPGVSLAHGDAPFVREFVLRLPGRAVDFARAAEKRRLLAGVPLERFDAARPNDLLVAVTEKRSREEMDRYVEALTEWAGRPAAKPVEEAAWN
jgi:glycine dehydrogenase subunit 1